MTPLQEKMQQYEVPPPARAWDRIAAALDEEKATLQFPAVLQNMEVPPPAGVWNKIADALQEPDAVPLRKKTFPFLRYAAAAMLTGAIAFAILKWTAGSSHRETVIVQAPAAADNMLTPVTPDAVTIPGTKSTTTAPKKTPLLAFVGRVVRPKATPHSRTHALLQARPDFALSLQDEYPEPVYSYDDHVPDMADRYIMLMTPDGNLIRMSKKWSTLLCCVSGEEQDPDCKDQIKKWQEKIATSTLAPSPGNFMDILSLVSSLNEEL